MWLGTKGTDLEVWLCSTQLSASYLVCVLTLTKLDIGNRVLVFCRTSSIEFEKMI